MPSKQRPCWNMFATTLPWLNLTPFERPEVPELKHMKANFFATSLTGYFSVWKLGSPLRRTFSILITLETLSEGVLVLIKCSFDGTLDLIDRSACSRFGKRTGSTRMCSGSANVSAWASSCDLSDRGFIRETQIPFLTWGWYIGLNAETTPPAARIP